MASNVFGANALPEILIKSQLGYSLLISSSSQWTKKLHNKNGNTRIAAHLSAAIVSYLFLKRALPIDPSEALIGSPRESRSDALYKKRVFSVAEPKPNPC